MNNDDGEALTIQPDPDPHGRFLPGHSVARLPRRRTAQHSLLDQAITEYNNGNKGSILREEVQLTQEQAIEIAKQAVIEAGWKWPEPPTEETVHTTFHIWGYWFSKRKDRLWRVALGYAYIGCRYTYIFIDDETGKVIHKVRNCTVRELNSSCWKEK